MQQDQQISEAIERERPRLRHFIRKRVADQSDPGRCGPFRPPAAEAKAWVEPGVYPQLNFAFYSPTMINLEGRREGGLKHAHSKRRNFR
jgi:hypothetical protein